MEHPDEIKKKEAEVGIQTEKIYQLVAQEEGFNRIRMEYDKYVKLLAELYGLFFDTLAKQNEKGKINEGQFKAQQEYLTNKHKEELIMLATAVDEALGLE